MLVASGMCALTTGYTYLHLDRRGAAMD